LAYKPLTDQQLRVYMTDLQTHSQRTAAARAGFSERTARRFDADPTPPSKRKIVHGRTVADPLEGYCETDLLPLLEKDSTLQAVTLLRHLQSGSLLQREPLQSIRQASTHWRSSMIAFGAPLSGGSGSGGR
jgi:hypothetical protein